MGTDPIRLRQHFNPDSGFASSLPVVPRSWRRTALATAVALTTILALAPAASAIPADAVGAVPPAATPAPESPDPLCEQSYADDEPRGGPPIRFGVGPRLAGE